VIELGRACAGIQKWKKSTNDTRSTPQSGSVDQTDQGHSWDQYPDSFHYIIDLGPFTSTA
jgi:hypothetical protein